MIRGRTRVLVLGGTGMLGHTLFERLSARDELDVHASVRDPAALTGRLSPERRAAVHAGVDATRPGSVERLVAEVRPAVLINAIGVVKQVAAAADPAATMELNARLPHRLARLAAATGGRLIHVSTDCVFSGAKGGYSEGDSPDPVDLYGRSKLLGEPSGDGVLSLRTSIVGHELASRHGLVDWFLAQAGPVSGYRRAIFSGMPTIVLADVLARVVLPRPDLVGLYHLSSAPISKLDLLELVAQRYESRAELQPSDEPAIDRSLDSSRFRTATGWQPPGWPELVDAMAADARARYRERFSASPRR